MGFDWQRIPLVREALRCKPYSIVEGEEGQNVPSGLRVVLNGVEKPLADITGREWGASFIPAEGWLGFIQPRKQDPVIEIDEE